MSVDNYRLQAQTGRNERHQRQPPLRRCSDVARREMKNDLDMKTAYEMSARSTNGRWNKNRNIKGLTSIVFCAFTVILPTLNPTNHPCIHDNRHNEVKDEKDYEIWILFGFVFDIYACHFLDEWSGC